MPRGSNIQSEFPQRLQAVCAEKRDILEQRSGEWVDPSRGVILGVVMEVLNDIGIDGSLHEMVELVDRKDFIILV